jgi:hypothetical protein
MTNARSTAKAHAATVGGLPQVLRQHGVQPARQLCGLCGPLRAGAPAAEAEACTQVMCIGKTGKVDANSHSYGKLLTADSSTEGETCIACTGCSGVGSVACSRRVDSKSRWGESVRPGQHHRATRSLGSGRSVMEPPLDAFPSRADRPLSNWLEHSRSLAFVVGALRVCHPDA